MKGEAETRTKYVAHYEEAISTLKVVRARNCFDAKVIRIETEAIESELEQLTEAHTIHVSSVDLKLEAVAQMHRLELNAAQKQGQADVVDARDQLQLAQHERRRLAAQSMLDMKQVFAHARCMRHAILLTTPAFQ